MRYSRYTCYGEIPGKGITDIFRNKLIIKTMLLYPIVAFHKVSSGHCHRNQGAGSMLENINYALLP